MQRFKLLAESVVGLRASWLGCFPGQNIRDVLARITGVLKVLGRAQEERSAENISGTCLATLIMSGIKAFFAEGIRAGSDSLNA